MPIDRPIATLPRFARIAMVLAAWVTPSAIAQTEAIQSAGGNTPAASPTPAPAADDNTYPTPLGPILTKGAGPTPAILIPDLGADASVFEDFLARHAARFTMHAITLPGFGGSKPPPPTPGDPPSSSSWLSNVEAGVQKLMTDRQIQNPVIIGHGLGGVVALRMARSMGVNLRGVIILDALPALALGDPESRPDAAMRRSIVDTVHAPRLARLTQEQWGEMWSRSAPSLVKDQARAKSIGAMVGAVPVGVGTRYTLEYQAQDLRDDLQHVPIPLLIIHALGDDPNPPISPQRRRDLVRAQFDTTGRATIVFVENARHYVFDDAPKAVDVAIGAFVDRLNGVPDAASTSPATPPAGAQPK